MYSLFQSALQSEPKQIAFILSNTQQLTYQEANDIIDDWAAFLYAQGIRPGNRVALISAYEDIYIFFHLALDKLNATMVLLDTDIPQAQLSFFDFVQFFFTDASFSPRLFPQTSQWQLINNSTLYPPASPCIDEPLQNRDAKIPNYIVASSGVTQNKKWIPICSAGLDYWAKVEKILLKLTSTDRILCTRSPGYDARISEAVRAFSAQGTLVLMSSEQRRNLEEIISHCEKYAISCLLLIASQLELAHQETLIERLAEAGLKHLLVTGDACSLNLKRCCEKYNVLLWNCYGPTEATFGMSILCVNDLHVYDEKGYPVVPIGLPNSEEIRYHIIENCLYIESPYLSPGYLNNDALTKKNFPLIQLVDKTIRVFNTENHFTEKEGYLLFHGRINDQAHCKIAGVKVEAYTIEQTLLEYNQMLGKNILHPYVVIKKWHNHLKPVAYLVLEGTINKQHFIDWLTNRLRQEEIPIFVQLSEFPRLATSEKINQQALIARTDSLEELFLSDHYKQVEATTTSSFLLIETLELLWQEVLGQKPVSFDQEFILAGGNSFQLTQLIGLIQQKINPQLKIRDFLHIKSISIRSLHQLLQNAPPQTNHLAIINPLSKIEPDRANCYLLPPLFGDGYFSYQSLSPIFHKFHPFNLYGLSDPSIYEPHLLPQSLDIAIARYANSICQIQKTKALHLAGFSWGAFLAWGVAKELTARQYKVLSISIIDGLPPLIYQRMPKEAHAQMLMEISDILLRVLNGPYYGEIIELSLAAQNLAAFPAVKQIDHLFTTFKKDLKNPLSFGLVSLAQQHLLFAHQASLPVRLPIFAKLYLTNKSQPYLARACEIITKTELKALQDFLLWNYYFDLMNYAIGRDAMITHGELLQKNNHTNHALHNYWQRSTFSTYGRPQRVIFRPCYFTIRSKKNIHWTVLGVEKSHCDFPKNIAIRKKTTQSLFEHIVQPAAEQGIDLSQKYCLRFKTLPSLAEQTHLFFKEKKFKTIASYGFSATHGEKSNLKISIECILNYKTFMTFHFNCYADKVALIQYLTKQYSLILSNKALPKNCYHFSRHWENLQNPSWAKNYDDIEQTMQQIVSYLASFNYTPALKYQNKKNGIAPRKLHQLKQLADEVKLGWISTSLDEQLAIIDSLTLHANYLEQQTEGELLNEQDKRKIVLSWLEAAFTVAKKSVPHLEQLLGHYRFEKDISGFYLLSYRTLSSLALLFHYLGKISRYNPDFSANDRLVLIQLALDIANFLDKNAGHDEEQDPHYYPERSITYMNPLWITLSQLGHYTEAQKIIHSQLSEACIKEFDFHFILAHTNLAVLLLKNTVQPQLVQALSHANIAIQRVLENEKNPHRENFSHHNIYFNARLAAIHALQALAENSVDNALAQKWRTEAWTRAQALQQQSQGGKAQQLLELETLLSELDPHLAKNYAKNTSPR